MYADDFLLLGGSRKISSIFYTDGSEIPKRSRQLAWRAAVEMSNNASQLALQVWFLFAIALKSSFPLIFAWIFSCWQHEGLHVESVSLT